MNTFHRDVYQIVSQIPAGKVVTYGQIAAMLGNPLAARRVGYAMRHAPSKRKLPCHRVINSKGEMLAGDVFGGEKTQRRRLQAEGVFFKANGCVDLKRSRWMFDIF